MKLRKYLSFMSALLTVFLLASCGFEAENKSSTSVTNNIDVSTIGTDPVKATTGKVLVAYFSATGTTEAVAGYIKEAVQADIYEIIPSAPYTAADLNYSDTNSRATSEQRDKSARPAISGSVENIGAYDVIFIGYPIWFGQAPRIISTFMESYDLNEKTIIPFCTSGGSGIGSSDIELHGLASGATWKEGKRFAGGTAEDAVAEWAESCID
ncbi:MAG: flavodoxin [Clostridiales bacterium]|nr:flavodoxin [Clostridiales bacterium]